MSAVLFVLLIFVPTVGLLGLLWWRFGGKGEQKTAPAVAPTNHPSIARRHYGFVPAIVAPPVAAPPLAAGNPLAQLMPEEDFRAQEEKEIQAEADRIEAEEAEQREAAEQASSPVAGPNETEVAAEAEPQPVAPAAQLVSSRHAAGATVSVFDALGLDEPAPVVDELPTAAAPEDDTVAESLFYNPFSVDAPTKNDKANSLTKAELRRLTREAIQAEAGGTKAALTSLLAENNPPR